jgi:hypothetical protein
MRIAQKNSFDNFKHFSNEFEHATFSFMVNQILVCASIIKKLYVRVHVKIVQN